MPIERERKFILKYMPELPADAVQQELKQAYLMIAADRQLRVRLINDEKAVLCYKQKVNTTDRNEFEYDIPYAEGLELYDLAKLKLPKKRYSWSEGGLHFDIDIYPEEIGFNIVEIEYTDELTSIPDFCGRDVSEETGYSNVAIAMKLKTSTNK